MSPKVPPLRRVRGKLTTTKARRKPEEIPDAMPPLPARPLTEAERRDRAALAAAISMRRHREGISTPRKTGATRALAFRAPVALVERLESLAPEKTPALVEAVAEWCDRRESAGEAREARATVQPAATPDPAPVAPALPEGTHQ